MLSATIKRDINTKHFGGNVMGFTIEDMLIVGGDRYKIELKAGKKGWSNSISWL